MTPVRPDRLVGLDVARCMALLGMVATHVLLDFTPEGDLSFSQWLAGGRASALFGAGTMTLTLYSLRQTPWIALVLGAAIGLVAIIVVDRVGGTAGDVILNVAVWGAVIAYVLQMVSFVLLRRKFPNAARPYRSPVGVPGAVVAGAIAVLTFVGILLNVDYRPAVVAIAIVFAVGLILFAILGRHPLVATRSRKPSTKRLLHCRAFAPVPSRPHDFEDRVRGDLRVRIARSASPPVVLGP